MKRFILLTGCILVFNGLLLAQTSIGLELGPNASNVVTKRGMAKSTSHLMAGPTIGIFGETTLSPHFVFRPALRYQSKGGSVNAANAYKIKSTLNYLEVVPDFAYRYIPFSGEGTWLFGAGPYLGYGLSGKQTSTMPNQGSYDIFKLNEMKRIDAGANFIIGYENNGWSFSFTGDIGLINTGGHGNLDNYNRNQSFSLLLGYLFKR